MAAETDLADKAAALLKQPYARLVVPEVDGTYRGEILEFPGCLSVGDTPAEALEAVEDIADAWLQSALAHNQPIPEPVDNTEFSGRLVLRMPKSLHKKAARLAEREGVSLNQFIVTCLAEQIGERARPAQRQVTVNASISQVTNQVTNLGNVNLIGAGPIGVTSYPSAIRAGHVPGYAVQSVVFPPDRSPWATISTDPIHRTG